MNYTYHLTSRPEASDGKHLIMKRSWWRNSLKLSIQKKIIGKGNMILCKDNTNETILGDYEPKSIYLQQFKYLTGLQCSFMRDAIEICRKIRHEHLVPYLDCFYMETQLNHIMYITIPSYELGNIQSLVGISRLTKFNIWNMMEQLSSALNALHGNVHPIIHRDICLENCMIDYWDKNTDLLRVVLADLDFSKNVNGHCLYHDNTGNEIYWSPEVAKSFDYSTKSDIWALGIILFQLMSGINFSEPLHHIITSENEKKEHEKLRIILYERNMYDHSLIEMVISMLRYNPGERPSSKRIFDYCILHHDIGTSSGMNIGGWLYKTKLIDVAPGSSHVLFLTEDGIVYAQGYNKYGQCGLHEPSYIDHPMRIIGLPKIKKIDAASEYSMALSESGQLYVWGRNEQSFYSIGVDHDKHVFSPTCILNHCIITDISAGNFCTCVLTSHGTVYSWGAAPYFEKIPTKHDICNIIKITTGNNHILVLRDDHTVYSWGSDTFGQLSSINNSRGSLKRVEGLDNHCIATIRAGEFLSTVLTTEGKVFAWGKIPSFKSEKNSKIVSRKQRTPMHIVKLENIIDVFVGTSSLFALSADGSWWVYGSNEDAKLGLDDVCPIGWQKITKLTKRNVRKIRSSRMGSFAICFDD